MNNNNQKNNKESQQAICSGLEDNSNTLESLSRRNVMKKVAAVGICATTAPCLLKAEEVNPDDPAHLMPQVNDCLVYADGEKEGQMIDLNDLVENKSFVNCWPRDPETGVVRNASRFNKLLAIRLKENEMNSKTAAYAKDGILVYSAICTHQGCDISAWVEEKQQFFCYCHYSRFDPKKLGKVAYGPARKKLPIIPIRIEEGVIKIDGEFSRKPG